MSLPPRCSNFSEWFVANTSGARAWSSLLWFLEEIHKPGKLFRQGLPPVEVSGHGRTLSLTGRLQGGVSGLGNLDLKLAPVGRVPCPRDQSSLLQSGEDAPERLALDMNLYGELFLVHGARCRGFQSDDGGARQPQRCQRIVVKALDHTGR